MVHMEINFYKYQGTGNDFVMVDNRSLQWLPTSEEVIRVCHRKFGVGADGLILIQNHDHYDFEMIYFNSDGSKSLCGNGSRCAIHFASQLGIVKDKTVFLTTDGVHEGEVLGEAVRFQLFDVESVQQNEHNFFVDTGSPHYVEFTEDVNKVDVVEQGQSIRYDEQFAPSGTNVNFVQIKEGEIFVRTYERGVEDETLSCGTGVTASAIAVAYKGLKSPVSIETLGGKLQVDFVRVGDHFKNIYLTGPATPVYQGTINL